MKAYQKRMAIVLDRLEEKLDWNRGLDQSLEGFPYAGAVKEAIRMANLSGPFSGHIYKTGKCKKVFSREFREHLSGNPHVQNYGRRIDRLVEGINRRGPLHLILAVLRQGYSLVPEGEGCAAIPIPPNSTRQPDPD